MIAFKIFFYNCGPAVADRKELLKVTMYATEFQRKI